MLPTADVFGFVAVDAWACRRPGVDRRLCPVELVK
jgi:hypothetical protein